MAVAAGVAAALVLSTALKIGLFAMAAGLLGSWTRWQPGTVRSTQPWAAETRRQSHTGEH